MQLNHIVYIKKKNLVFILSKILQLYFKELLSYDLSSNSSNSSN